VYCSDPPVDILSAGDAGDTAFAAHLRYPEERSSREGLQLRIWETSLDRFERLEDTVTLTESRFVFIPF